MLKKDFFRNIDFYAYPHVQCAAVSTQSALIRVPPQKTLMLLPLSRLSATCHGTSPKEAADPPTILLGPEPFPDILFSDI